jgi:hypothetical protein
MSVDQALSDTFPQIFFVAKQFNCFLISFLDLYNFFDQPLPYTMTEAVAAAAPKSFTSFVMETPIQSVLRNLDVPILIAGCGGGFDVFGGLPLYFSLKEAGKTVYLANYTFSGFHDVCKGKKVTADCYEVNADTSFEG